MPYPCCCGVTCDGDFVCGTALTLEISGAVDGSCGDCETQYNDTLLTTTGGAGGTGTYCGITSDENCCEWNFSQDSNPCFPDDTDSTVTFFIAGGQRYVAVLLEDDDLGAFGETFAGWLKAVSNFNLPITLTSADYGTPCESSETKCDLSGATIVISQ